MVEMLERGNSPLCREKTRIPPRHGWPARLAYRSMAVDYRSQWGTKRAYAEVHEDPLARDSGKGSFLYATSLGLAITANIQVSMFLFMHAHHVLITVVILMTQHF